jgi:hypothetical protein
LELGFDMGMRPVMGGQLAQHIDDGGIVARAAAIDNHVERLDRRQFVALDQAFLQRFIIAGDQQNTCAQGNGGCPQVGRISVSVVMFAMIVDQLGCIGQRSKRHQYRRRMQRMFVKLGALLVGQFGERSVEQAIRQADLADVMQQRGNLQIADLCFREPHAARNVATQLRDAARMSGHRALAQFHQVGEDMDGGEVIFFQLFVRMGHGFQRIAQFLGALAHLVFQAGIQRLQFLVLAQGQRLQALFFGQQIFALQRIAHRQHDIVVVPWLGNIAIDFAAIDRRNGGVEIRISGQQNAHHVWPFGACLLQHLGAVHCRHTHVADHQVDSFFFQ